MAEQYKRKVMFYKVNADKEKDLCNHFGVQALPTLFFIPAIIEQETFHMVRKAVEELPTQMRNIILYSMKGLKNHEIADKLQISEGTVHTLKKFAYRKLRESLKGINYTLLLFLCK